MRILINNTVKTDTSDYTFNTREEAEAFYLTLKPERGGHEAQAQAAAKPRKSGARKHPAHPPA